MYVCSDAHIPGDPRYDYQAPFVCTGLVQGPGGTLFTVTWAVDYITESGEVYREAWGAQPRFNTKHIYVTWYDRVPATSYPPSLTGQISSTGLTPLGTIGTPNTLAGQRIVAGRLSYRAFDCGFQGTCGYQEKLINIYYETPPPANVFAWTGTPDNSATVTEQHPLPCRTGIYTLQCDDVRDATYDWTTTVGSITGTGRRATLDLSQVPANTTTVMVSVRATNLSAPCGQQSNPHQALFYLPATPAPSAISIDGVALSCPGSNVRTLTVPPVTADATYTWQVTAGNAILLNPNSSLPFSNPTPPVRNSVLIQFNGPGQVEVTAVANSACGTTSTPAYATYQATGGVIPNPLAALNPFNEAYSWQYNTAVRIPLSSPQPGVLYTFGPVSNARYFTVWPGATPSTPTAPGDNSLITLVPGPNGAAYIDLTLNYVGVASFDLQVQSTGSCGGSSTLTQIIHETRPYHGSYLRAMPAEVSQLQTDNPDPAEQAMALYPNPVGDVLHIAPAGAGSRYQWVRVVDAQGTPLREARATGNERLTQLSLTGLPAGLYAVQLFDGKRIITRHLAKE